MKVVSFEVAKAIKEAGYPQGITKERYILTGLPTSENPDSIPTYADKPTYLDVWLWLWREKKIVIDTEYCLGKWGVFELGSNHSREGYIYNDPEECIIASIKYLVENSLIK